jgi:phosphohistidine phosphatase
LAPRGRRDAPAAGRWLRKSDYVPDRVLCSTARRARETWQLAEEKLGVHPATALEDRVYGASSTDLLALARQTSADVRTLLIVGHDPAMQELTLELGDEQTDDAGSELLDRVRAKYPTAAVAVLSFSGGWTELGRDQARLTAFVVPDDFHAGDDRRR